MHLRLGPCEFWKFTVAAYLGLPFLTCTPFDMQIGSNMVGHILGWCWTARCTFGHFATCRTQQMQLRMGATEFGDCAITA